MNRNFYYFVIFLFVINCSFDTKTGIWTNSEKIISESKDNEENLFEKVEIYEKEFNVDLKIRLKSNSKKNNFNENLTNNNGVINFNSELKKISKYKFSKIDQFDQYQPELLVTYNNNLIFFNDKGSVLNFAKNNKLVWKSNIYSKNEKKQNPILYFASNDKI